MNDKGKRIAGALYGVAIGDALGAPLEFMDQGEIIRKHGRVTEMIGGGWLNVKPGEITDDTQMTLAVAEGIVEDPDSPIKGVGARFIRWAKSGPKDIGTTCSMSIRGAAIRSRHEAPGEEIWFKASEYTCEINGGRSGGNGALMRTVYPGLYYEGLLMAVETAGAIAQMTHWDQESTEACNLYTEMIHLITDAINDEEAWRLAKKVLKRSQYKLEPQKGTKPTGYVVNSFKCALHSLAATETFEAAIIQAANLGGDADTIAAITGGLAGAIYGYDAIPERWIRTLSPDIKAQLNRLAEVATINRQGRAKMNV